MKVTSGQYFESISDTYIDLPPGSRYKILEVIWLASPSRGHTTVKFKHPTLGIINWILSPSDVRIVKTIKNPPKEVL